MKHLGTSANAADIATKSQLPSNFPETFLGVSGANGQNMGSGFNTVQTSTLDAGSNSALWSASDWCYVVPSTGLYLLQGTYRPQDSSTTGLQFGAGLHTSNIDGVWFVWHAVQNTTVTSRRTTYPVGRMTTLTAGAKVRMFAYVDGGSLAVQVAGWQIIRIA